MKMDLKLKLIGVLLTFGALAGCGGDDTGQITDSYIFPTGTSTLAFTAMSTSQLSTSISGIDFSVTLPQGMNVITANGGSGPIEAASITAGSALAGTNLAFGNYSASTRTAHLSMATTSNNYRSGEFLRLACTVDPNTNITLGSLKTANSPVPIQKAVGWDPFTTGTILLTNQVRVTIGVAN